MHKQIHQYLDHPNMHVEYNIEVTVFLFILSLTIYLLVWHFLTDFLNFI